MVNLLGLNDFSLNTVLNGFVKLVSVNEVCSDAAERWQLGFQDPASPIMEGIEHFHNDIMFFVVVIAIFVSYVLWRCLQLFKTDEPRNDGSLSNHILHMERYKNGVYHHTLIEVI